MGVLRLSTIHFIFQLYHVGHIYWCRKLEYTEKTTDMLQGTDKFYQIKLYWIHYR